MAQNVYFCNVWEPPGPKNTISVVSGGALGGGVPLIKPQQEHRLGQGSGLSLYRQPQLSHAPKLSKIPVGLGIEATIPNPRQATA